MFFLHQLTKPSWLGAELFLNGLVVLALAVNFLIKKRLTIAPKLILKLSFGYMVFPQIAFHFTKYMKYCDNIVDKIQ